jgi:hypothetical protein
MVLLIGVVMMLMKGKPIEIEKYGQMKMTWVIILLIGIYLFGGVYLIPERFPDEVMPYITIGVFYVVVSWLLYRSKPSNKEGIDIGNVYLGKTLVYLMIFLTLMIVGMSFICVVGNVVLVIAYFGYTVIGILILFVFVMQEIMRKDHRVIVN